MTYLQALKLLEIAEPFGPVELKSAFKSKAFLFHPDRNSSSDAVIKFRECLLAYEILAQHLSAQKSNLVIENPNDIFDDILGYSEQNRILGFHKPEIIQISITEYLFGINREEKLRIYKPCSDCQATGALPKTKSQLCPYCFGAGRIKNGQKTELICPKCQSKGRLIEHPCPTCTGYGNIAYKKKVHLDIKAGFQLNESFCFGIKNSENSNHHECYIKPILKNDSFFVVENGELLCHFCAPHSMQKSGGSLDFPSLWGWVELLIPQTDSNFIELELESSGLINPFPPHNRGMLKLLIRFVSEREFVKLKKRFYKLVSQSNPNYSQTTPLSWWQKIFR